MVRSQLAPSSLRVSLPWNRSFYPCCIFFKVLIYRPSLTLNALDPLVVWNAALFPTSPELHFLYFSSQLLNIGIKHKNCFNQIWLHPPTVSMLPLLKIRLSVFPWRSTISPKYHSRKWINTWDKNWWTRQHIKIILNILGSNLILNT